MARLRRQRSACRVHPLLALARYLMNTAEDDEELIPAILFTRLALLHIKNERTFVRFRNF